MTLFIELMYFLQSNTIFETLINNLIFDLFSLKTGHISNIAQNSLAILLQISYQAVPKTTFHKTLKFWDFPTHEVNKLISINLRLRQMATHLSIEIEIIISFTGRCGKRCWVSVQERLARISDSTRLRIRLYYISWNYSWYWQGDYS